MPIPPSVEGFRIRLEPSAKHFLIVLHPGVLRFPSNLSWTPSSLSVSLDVAGGRGEDRAYYWQKKRAIDGLEAITPREARAIDALLALMPALEWMISISSANIFVWLPPGAEAAFLERVVKAMVKIAGLFADDTELERLTSTVRSDLDAAARRHALLEVLRLEPGTMATGILLEHVRDNDKDLSLRTEADARLGGGNDVLMKIFAEPDDVIVKKIAELAFAPELVVLFEHRLCEKLDVATEPVGAAIASLLADHGTEIGLTALDKEQKEKVFHRRYKRVLKDAAAKLRARIHKDAGAVTLADDAAGAVSKP